MFVGSQTTPLGPAYSSTIIKLVKSGLLQDLNLTWQVLKIGVDFVVGGGMARNLGIRGIPLEKLTKESKSLVWKTPSEGPTKPQHSSCEVPLTDTHTHTHLL